MNSDNIAITSLIKLGYQVEEIPTSNKKEADFLVRYKENTALIEAKLKEDSPETVEKKESDLIEKNISVVESQLGRNETYSGIIKSASKQLKSSSDKSHDFKIILFIVSGSNPKSKKDQMKDTIYGSTLICDGNKSKTCYFFRNSDFFRRPNIDAVILGECSACNSRISFELCLNPYSENYKYLKNSNFIKPFGKALIDPIELEKNGLAYIPDDNCARRLNETQKLVPMYNPILQHLQEKYKTGYLVAGDFKSPEITVVA